MTQCGTYDVACTPKSPSLPGNNVWIGHIPRYGGNDPPDLRPLALVNSLRTDTST